MQRESALSVGPLGMRALVVSVLLVGTGCAAETVVHGLNEKEANQIIEVLADNDITSNKLVNNTGREILYDVAVPAADKLAAIRVLNKHELPRRRDKGYQEVFAGTGIIPTSAEEKAKKLAALEGEIERQIKLIDGILDVQVQIVMPDESALRTTREQEPPTTAGVTVRYLPRPGGARPVTEPQIQALVAAGVEKLLPENVTVIIPQPPSDVPEATAAKKAKGPLLADKRTLMIFAAAVVVVALLGLGLILSQIQLRRVRGRLIRLQSEIAKAKRKPGDALSAPGQIAS